MALSALSGDEAGIVFTQLSNALEPRIAVAFSSASHGLWESTQAQRQQLRVEHEAAAVLCLKVGLRSCKKLREAKRVTWGDMGITADDLATLGSLSSVLPVLEELRISGNISGPDGVQRLAAGLGAGALPALYELYLLRLHVGDAGASALAAALGRGALPRIKEFYLSNTDIGDAGLVALAPALRRRPALMKLYLGSNRISEEGITALVAPPPLAGALPPPAGVLAKLKMLGLDGNQITDAGCATLATALDSGALPALNHIGLTIDQWEAADTSASMHEALAAMHEALARSVERRVR